MIVYTHSHHGELIDGFSLCLHFLDNKVMNERVIMAISNQFVFSSIKWLSRDRLDRILQFKKLKSVIQHGDAEIVSRGVCFAFEIYEIYIHFSGISNFFFINSTKNGKKYEIKNKLANIDKILKKIEMEIRRKN